MGGELNRFFLLFKLFILFWLNNNSFKLKSKPIFLFYLWSKLQLIFQVEKLYANSKHPFSKFSTGTRKTFQVGFFLTLFLNPYFYYNSIFEIWNQCI